MINEECEPYVDHGSSLDPEEDVQTQGGLPFEHPSALLSRSSSSSSATDLPFEYPSITEDQPSRSFLSQGTITEFLFEQPSQKQSFPSKSQWQSSNEFHKHKSITELPFEPSSKTQHQPSNIHQQPEIVSDHMTGDQGTLLACLGSNHELPRHDRDQIGIFAHGPSHQGSRTLLMMII